MTAEEEWRPVPGFEGYMVSDLGRVRSHRGPAPRILRPGINLGGYPSVVLSKTSVYVHRLVAFAFHGDPEPGQEVRHLDGDRLHCAATNLAWGSRSENALDRIRHGRHNHASKTHCVKGHPLAGNNVRLQQTEVFRRRVCRTCQREAQRRRRARLAA